LIAGLLLCGPASAATATPVLLAPSASSSSSTPLTVSYELPEAASVATLTFANAKGTTSVVLGTAEYGAGEHTISLNTHDLTANKTEVKSASAATLADGTYEVVLSYQNLAAESAASATATGVRILTVTAAPKITAPESGKSFEGRFSVSYELPEAALAGSVQLIFEGEETGVTTLVLINAAAGEHTVMINPAAPELEAGVASSSSTKLEPGPYLLRAEYQDQLGNPAASSLALKLTVLAVKCTAGTYSETGRVPCLKASPGHYVTEAGANAQTPCVIGSYDPSAGSTLASECVAAEAGHYVAAAGASEQTQCVPGSYTALSKSYTCTPASLGHYVAEAGASEELECVAGTYSPTTDASFCVLSPPGHYTLAGSAAPIPCPRGTSEPDTDAAGPGACIADLPGYYSLIGSAAATKCEAGRYAPKSESFKCELAEPGFFVEAEGASVELPCPAGSYSPLSGASSCALAPAGTYAPEGAKAPVACPAGTEAPVEGRSACSVVPKAPLVCPAGTEATAQGTVCSAIPTPPTSTGSHPAAASQPPLRCTLVAATRQESLSRREVQAYVLSCNLAATLTVRGSFTITTPARRLKIAATAATVTVSAGRTSVQTLRVRLTRQARALLRSSRARVSFTLTVYRPATGGAAGAQLAHATLAGRR